MCENFNRVFVYMLREFLKQTDPKTIRGVSKERMLIQKKPTPTDFQKYSVQRWAISELITAILANPCNSAEDTAYRLALTFYKCAYAAVDSRMYEVFHITDGDSLENYWFTPMYFSDFWCTRRIIRRMQDILESDPK